MIFGCRLFCTAKNDFCNNKSDNDNFVANQNKNLETPPTLERALFDTQEPRSNDREPKSVLLVF